MDIFLLIGLFWITAGLVLLVSLVIDTNKTLTPVISNMLILQKFVDRNKGIHKSTHKYQTEAKPPVANFPVKEFKISMIFKILFFYWIIYLLIVVSGYFLLKIVPSLQE